MRNLTRTDFDNLYDELSLLNEGRKVRSEHSAIKGADANFNHRQISMYDITMNLPEEVKLEYIEKLNETIQEKGRLLNYLNDPVGKQIHHINLKALGGDINSLNNFMVVYPDDHLLLHKTLSNAINKYLELHPEDADIYGKARGELNSASAVLALNSEVTPEQFIDDYYNAAKAQSLRKIIAQPTYSTHEHIPNIKPDENSIPVVLVNIKVEGGEIYPDYNRPEILSVRQAANYLKGTDNARKDIRVIRAKNAE